MPIIDANDLPDRACIEADICIIGAGAAGITLATQLEGTRHRVCLLESGGFDADEALQALYELDNVGYPIRENFMSRARYFGGTCNVWAGRTMRLSRIDLLRRDWVPYSGWPIGYEELERYYRRAEQILRLPAFEHLEAAASAGGSPQEAALLDNGRIWPSIALWGTKPLRFGKVHKGALRRSRNIDTYINGSVTELLPASSGAGIDRLRVETLQGRGLTAKARYYVLACGGLESARLMLVSSSRHADGLGNERGLVGRFFQDHPRAIFGRIRLRKPVSLPYVLGMPIAAGKVQTGLRLSDELQREGRLLNSYVSLEPQLSRVAEQQYETVVNAAKILLRRGHAGRRTDIFRMRINELKDMAYLLTPKEIMPHALYRPYAWLKRQLRKTVSATHLTIVNYCEQAPNPASRVYLGERRDALGVRSLVLDWRVGEDELRSIRALHRVLGEVVASSGIGALEADAREGAAVRFTDASHHIGTLRMSESPETGVVDPNCKVHGLANLFVAGSATFPTAGHANPTLTIVALAVRLGEHLGRLASRKYGAAA